MPHIQGKQQGCSTDPTLHDVPFRCRDEVAARTGPPVPSKGWRMFFPGKPKHIPSVYPRAIVVFIIGGAMRPEHESTRGCLWHSHFIRTTQMHDWSNLRGKREKKKKTGKRNVRCQEETSPRGRRIRSATKPHWSLIPYLGTAQRASLSTVLT